MSAEAKEHSIPEQDRRGRLSRRAFMQAGLLGAGAAALLPLSVPVAKSRDVSRNRTLTLVWTGREGRWVDHELWNPYAIGANHQSGPGIFYEPPYIDSVKDLPAQYNTLEFNPKKGEEILSKKGWKKDRSGFWVDARGGVHAYHHRYVVR